jgi:hypothetical protein
LPLNLTLLILCLRSASENGYSEANARTSGRFVRFSWHGKA